MVHVREPAPSLRAFLAGNSGSGKSTRAWDLYLQGFPRRILLDMTGEWTKRADVRVENVPQLVDAVRSLAGRGRWTIAVSFDPAEMPDLVDWLIPVPQLDQSPVRVLGGLVILVDEVDLIAPQGPAPEEVRTLYRRSRHVGLSVVSTTQRPANVSREVSAQSGHAVALYLSEPRDRDYMIDLMRLETPTVTTWLRWTQRHPHGGLWKDLQKNRLLWLPEKGAPVASAGVEQLQLDAGPSVPRESPRAAQGSAPARPPAPAAEGQAPTAQLPGANRPTKATKPASRESGAA